MKPFSNKRVFGLSVLVGMVAVIVTAGFNHRPSQPKLQLSKLTSDISVSEQLRPDAVPSLKAQGFATVIDLRPDGEAGDQPPAAAMELAARANKMSFSYVPVPHGDIPDAAVVALGKAIVSSPRPILLYCHSGRRAARTWSLAEASRPGGLDPKAIQAAVNGAGQSAEDLKDAINQRVAGRSQANGATP